MRIAYRALRLMMVMLAMLAALPAISLAHEEEHDKVIEDPVLEQAILRQLEIEDRALELEDLYSLTSLYPREEGKITSLKGLEHAYSLQSLYLPDNEISDLTPLANLTELDILALNGNQIENICPVSGLPHLRQLIAFGNRIANIDCLSSLTSLTDLLLSDNQITSVNGITSSALRWVMLENNRIQSIAPLGKLKQLQYLFINGNQVTELAPLLQINNLKLVQAEGNPLNEASNAVLQQLQRYGVKVNQSTLEPDGDKAIWVYIDGLRIPFETAPFIEQGSTLVPFRSLFEAFGLKVGWDGATRTITGNNDELSMKLQIGSGEASVNGRSFELPVSPRIVSDSTFVPLRFIGESLHYEVLWDADEREIRIFTKPQVLLSNAAAVQVELPNRWVSQTSEEMLRNYDLAASDPHGNYFAVGRVYKSYLDEGTSLQSYTKQKSDIVRDAGFEDFKISGLKKGVTAGMKSISFTYSGIFNESYAKAFVTTFETSNSFVDMVLVVMNDSLPEAEQEWEHIQNSLQIIKTVEELNEERFGGMTPEERFLDAAGYYRSKGYFASLKEKNEADFKAAMLALYDKQVYEDGSDPFVPGSFDSLYADFYVLSLDQERSWLGTAEDTEPEVVKGSYKKLLEQWAGISQGVFAPTNIAETWTAGEETDEVTVTFTFDGQTHTLHPYTYGAYVDTDIIYELNEIIEPSGYMFERMYLSTGEFVTMLRIDERSKMIAERLLPLY